MRGAQSAAVDLAGGRPVVLHWAHSISGLSGEGCGDRMPDNPDRPLCKGCFKAWNRWENEDYEEEYCHTCGAPNKTSMNRPQCKPCWSETCQYS